MQRESHSIINNGDLIMPDHCWRLQHTEGIKGFLARSACISSLDLWQGWKHSGNTSDKKNIIFFKHYLIIYLI